MWPSAIRNRIIGGSKERARERIRRRRRPRLRLMRPASPAAKVIARAAVSRNKSR